MGTPRKERKERVVMIVEAGEIALSTRKLILETEGFNVLSAVTMEQSEKLLSRCPADLLLFDVDVDPNGESSDFLRRVKQEQNIPIYALTSHAWTPDELRDAVDGNFQKALDPRGMVEEIVRILKA